MTLNHTRLSAFIFFILLASVFSCKKDHAPLPPPVILDSLQINLDFPKSRLGQTTATEKYELIITESGGKILMDTVTPYNIPIIAWLKTNQKLLDITIVQKWNSTISYFIHTYKAIDLTAWVNIPDNDSIQLPSGGPVFPPPSAGIIDYRHVNVPLGSYYNFLAYGTAATGQVFSNELYGNYNAPTGDYAYLIFPDLGLYNLHHITSNYDYVDLSNPDTAVRVTFNRPAAYTTAGFSLAGFPDTTFLAYNVNLTYLSAAGTSITNATNLVYPGKKGFKKYYFFYYVSDASNTNFASVNLPYVDTIPDNLPIPDPAWYTTTLTSDTSLITGFGTHKPTYYEVISHIGDMSFAITAPGDSTVLHLASIKGLKSKLLANRDLNQLHPDYVNIVTDAELDYLAYWVSHTKIYQAWKGPGSAYTTFQHRF